MADTVLSAMDAPATPRAGVRPLGILAVAVGVALFAWTLRQTGIAPVLQGIRRVGGGFLVIVAIGGLRFWVRAAAWALATETTPRVGPRETFPAWIAADTLGNLTPLGMFVSEPAKIAFIRSRTTLMSAIAGITVENVAYALTVMLVIASGMVALLSLFDVGESVRRVAAGGLIVIAVGLGLGAWMLHRRVRLVSGTVEWLGRRRRVPAALGDRLAKLRALEETVYTFAARSPSRMAAIFGLELSFHVLGVAEMWYTLGLLAGAAAPTLLSTFVLEAVNRTIMVVFKVIPLRLGVDEVGTELLTRTMGLATGIGVTMAIVRKARMTVWSLVGLAFLARRSLR